MKKNFYKIVAPEGTRDGKYLGIEIKNRIGLASKKKAKDLILMSGYKNAELEKEITEDTEAERLQSKRYKR